MSKKCHVLISRERGKKWMIDFHHYSRRLVDIEKRKCKREEPSLQYRIVTTAYETSAIHAKVDALNGV